jgi:hypothetical protein
MDPVVAPAVIGLVSHWGGKILDKLLEDGGQDGGVAVDNAGELHSLAPIRTSPTSVALGLPSLYEGFDYPPVTNFLTQFVPADEQALAWLEDDQPVLLIIDDEEDSSELSAFGLGTTLGTPTPVQLPPGRYSLAALVFLDESFDDIDGFGAVDFTVAPGEADFALVVPIVSDADGAVSYSLLDFLASRCRAVTRGGERCKNHISEQFLLVCTSHGQAIEDGSTFLDALRLIELTEGDIEVPDTLLV